MIFLDTHVVVWLYQGRTDLLSTSAEKIIEKEDDIYISPIVLLELQYLFEIGKIIKPAKVVIEALVEDIGLEMAGDSFDEVVEQSLSENWTRDPFDRIIVAQARKNTARLISKDRLILENYGKGYF
jgi:PIN domain nuclease of toxin-antitoxin system